MSIAVLVAVCSATIVGEVQENEECVREFNGFCNCSVGNTKDACKKGQVCSYVMNGQAKKATCKAYLDKGEITCQNPPCPCGYPQGPAKQVASNCAKGEQCFRVLNKAFCAFQELGFKQKCESDKCLCRIRDPRSTFGMDYIFICSAGQMCLILDHEAGCYDKAITIPNTVCDANFCLCDFEGIEEDNFSMGKVRQVIKRDQTCFAYKSNKEPHDRMAGADVTMVPGTEKCSGSECLCISESRQLAKACVKNEVCVEKYWLECVPGRRLLDKEISRQLDLDKFVLV